MHKGSENGILGDVCAPLDGEMMSMRASWGLPTLSGAMKSPLRHDFYAGQIAPRVPHLRKQIFFVKWESFQERFSRELCSILLS